MSRVDTIAVAGVLATVFGCAGNGGNSGGAGSPSATALTGLGSNWYAAAPYVMPSSNNPPDLPTVMATTGQKSFMLAFILAYNNSSCSPAWDGTSPVSSDTQVASVISAVRAAGGDVSVAIGGYGGIKLGQVCGSAAATAAAYQQVIDKYRLVAMDFDLEEPEYENTAAVNNELGAAQILQTNNPGLYISVTMPGTTSGTGWFGQQLLNTAKSFGFTPNNYSIMPFDGGFSGASSQIAALEAFHSLLMSTFGWDSASAYAREGFSGMNGRSDSAEYFYQSDFQTVLDYARGHGLGRFTFWSVNRDRQCSPPDNGATSGTCSSVAQSDWEFTKFCVSFAGSTPAPSDFHGKLVSLRVTTNGFTDRYLRHQNGLGVTSVVNASSDDLTKRDATFWARPGLASSSCYSFESRNFPNDYLRHSSSRLRKDANDGSSLFAQDATFCPKTGLSGTGTSFESYNYPNHYLRHINGEVYIAINGGSNAWDSSNSFAADSSWSVDSAWWRSGADLSFDQAHSFQVVTSGFTDRYLRHQNGLGVTSVVNSSSNDLTKQDSTFYVRRGLADGSCYSFESRNFRNDYLRHSGFRIRKDANDGSALFKSDATFCAQPGLNGSDVSFTPYAIAGKYLRHMNAELWIGAASGPDPGDGFSGTFAADATWHVADAWAP